MANRHHTYCDKTVLQAILTFVFAFALTIPVFAENAAGDVAAAVGGADASTVEKSGIGAGKRFEVGMSLEDALKSAGEDPESEQEIGAACGMLDVFTYEDGTQIISVDGTVTAIVEGKKKQEAGDPR